MSFAALRAQTWRRRGPWRSRVDAYEEPQRMLFTPADLGLRAWYDAEVGQPRGVGYVQLDGASGDSISTPDRANLRFTGAFEVEMRLYCNDWTAVGNQTLCGRYLTAGNLRSWRLFVDTSGRISIAVSSDGTAGTVSSSLITPTVPLADASWQWLKATFLPNDGGGNRVANLFTAPDTGSNYLRPVSWTANGTDLDPGVPAAHFAAVTAPLEIGAFQLGTLERFSGRIGRCIVRDGIDGTSVADFNASDCYGAGYTHTDGYAWSLGLPKIYDRSGNNVAPATFGAGSNMPQWLAYNGEDSIYIPGVAGNLVNIGYSEGAASNLVSWEAAVKVSLDSLGVNQFLAGSGATHFTFQLTTSNLMKIQMLDAGLTLQIGGANSPAIPGLVAGVPIWLRGRVAQATALCEYWYSFDPTDDPTAVTWTSLGSSVGSNAGASVLLTQSGKSIYGGYSSGLAGMSGFLYAGQQIQNDGTVNRTTRFRARRLTQTAGAPDAGNSIAITRPSAGRKAVVQSRLAGSARGVILHGTDDWIDIPAAAVPALDTNAAASSATVVSRRWHNPGTAGHAIFATKANAAGATLGTALRLSPTAGSTVISQVTSDGTIGDQADSSVPLGARGVSTIRAASTSPFVQHRANDLQGVDTVRDTTVSTATGAAGRLGAYTGGTAAIDMEFEALIARNVDTTDTEHGLLAAYYRGGL